MIGVKKLTKTYGGHKALAQVSFEIETGELVGLVGENGAGKTTLLHLLSGYLPPTSGQIFMDGKAIAQFSTEERRAIGYLPEQAPLYEHMGVWEYLDFIYGMKKPIYNRRKHIGELMERLKLTEVSHRVIGNLSKGYRQRIGLCAALMGYPKVILLDEPMSGLDPTQIQLVRSLLLDLQKEHIILFSSHILPEVQTVCKRILFLQKGRLQGDKLEKGNFETLLATVQGQRDYIQKRLQKVEWVSKVRHVGQVGAAHQFALEHPREKEVRPAVTRALQEERAQLLELVRKEVDLERLFFDKEESQ